MDQAQERGLAGRVVDIETDLYKGRGPRDPSVTTRLSVMETAVAEIKESVNGLKVWALGIIGAVLADVVVHFLKK